MATTSHFRSLWRRKHAVALSVENSTFVEAKGFVEKWRYQNSFNNRQFLLPLGDSLTFEAFGAIAFGTVQPSRPISERKSSTEPKETPPFGVCDTGLGKELC